MSELIRYRRALLSGSLDVCVEIEKRYDLFGYPPEVVSVGLRAADAGEDVYEAIERYLSEGAT